jgi:hypothetical protein
MLAASRRSTFQLAARIDTSQPAELAESGQQESAWPTERSTANPPHVSDPPLAS